MPNQKKYVIINRAVPGSGKTTISKKIVMACIEKRMTVSIHSTDEYFMFNRRYFFDVSKLAEYHNLNLNKFIESINRGDDLVICDNTNLSPAESEPYTMAARKEGYGIIIVNFPPRRIADHIKSQQLTGEKPDAHQVPEKTIVEMINSYHKYLKFLDKNYNPQPGFDSKFRWDSTKLSLERTDEILGNYDYDHLITVMPDKYLDAQISVPTKVMEFLCPSNRPPLQIWLEILNKGDAKNAQKYYFDKILPDIVQKIYKENTSKPCDLLVSLMGFSPETTILTTAYLRPKKLTIITSSGTAENYNLACEFILKNKILDFNQISILEIDVTDPKSIYTKILSESERIAHLYVDITGGKKIMSAAAAQAAWELNASLCYIEGKYDPQIRRPHPGSEKLVVLENPSQEKARFQRSKGIDAWNLRNFSTAENYFLQSKRLLTDHRFEDLAIPLCRFFQSLYKFDENNMRENIDSIKEVCEHIAMKDTINRININKIIEIFSVDQCLDKPNLRIALFLSLAREYSQQERYDFAGLLSYRAIEALVIEGLRIIARGKNISNDFNPSNPDYSMLTNDLPDLKARLGELWKKNPALMQSLPERVSLANGFALLLTLDQQRYLNLFKGRSINAAYALNKLSGICSVRNNSILAHGNHALGKDGFESIFSTAMGLFNIVFEDDCVDKAMNNIAPPSFEAFSP